MALNSIAVWVLLLSTMAMAQQTVPRESNPRPNDLPQGALARLGSSAFRFPCQVEAVAFSADSRSLFVTTADGKVRWVDAASGSVSKTVATDGPHPTAIAAAADGKTLAVAGDGEETMPEDLIGGPTLPKITLLDAVSGKVLPVALEEANSPTPRLLSFSPDGKGLFLASSRTKWWDVATGDRIRTFLNNNTPIMAIATAPDGSFLALADTERAIRLWDYPNGKIRHSLRSELSDLAKGPLPAALQSAMFSSVAVSPDSKTVAACASGGYIVTWDAASGKMLRYASVMPSLGIGLAFAGKGKSLLVRGRYEGVVAVDAETLQKRYQLEDGLDRGAFQHQMALSPDEKRLALTGCTEDRSVRIWDLDHQTLVGNPKGHRGQVHAILPLADNRHAVTVGRDDLVLMWDLLTGEIKRSHQLDRSLQGNTSITCSPDGGLLAVGPPGGGICLIDLASGKTVATLGKTEPADFAGKDHLMISKWRRDGTASDYSIALALPSGTDRAVRTMQFSADGKTLLALEQGQCRLWEMSTRKLLWESREAGDGADRFYRVQWMPGGERIMTVTSAQRYVILKASDGTPDKTIKPPDFESTLGSIAVSAGPARLYTTINQQVVRVDIGSNAVTRLPVTSRKAQENPLFPGDTLPSDFYVVPFALSSDGHWLAVYGDKELAIRDGGTGEVLRSLKMDVDDSLRMAFTPDGKKLITSCPDASLLVWDVAALAAAGK